MKTYKLHCNSPHSSSVVLNGDRLQFTSQIFVKELSWQFEHFIAMPWCLQTILQQKTQETTFYYKELQKLRNSKLMIYILFFFLQTFRTTIFTFVIEFQLFGYLVIYDTLLPSCGKNTNQYFTHELVTCPEFFVRLVLTINSSASN